MGQAALFGLFFGLIFCLCLMISSAEITTADPATTDAAATPSATADANPATTVNANPATTVNANPATTVNANPATTVNANPANTVNANPATTVNANPATTVNANPANTVNANPANTVNANPATTVNANPATTVNANPANTVNANPANTSNAKPATTVNANPATTVNANPANTSNAKPASTSNATSTPAATSNPKPSTTTAIPGPKKCTEWEADLATKLAASADITPFLLANTDKLPSLSESCVKTFSNATSKANLKKLMAELDKVYDNLNPGSRLALFLWIEQMNPKPANGSSWMTVEQLTLLDRFLLQASLSSLKTLAGMESSPLCAFFNSSNEVWKSLYDLNPAQANIFITGLKKCSIDVAKAENIAKLGQLACFYPVDDKPLEDSPRTKLLELLKNCKSDVKNVYQKLMTSMNVTSFGASQLGELGDAAAGLGIKQLASLSKEAVVGSLSTLSKIEGFSKSQKEALLKAAGVADIISKGNVASLGKLASALDSSALGSIPAAALVTAFADASFAASTAAMEPLQKKSLVLSVLKTKSADEALTLLPPALITEMTTKKLQEAGALSTAMLGKMPWNKGQALVVMAKAFSNLKTAEDFKKLGRAAQGITCEQITGMAADSLEALSASDSLSRDQIRCASTAYFKAAKSFSNLTSDEISKIPSNYLLYLKSFKDVETVPTANCASVVSVFAKVEHRLLGKSSKRREEVLNYVKTCMSISSTDKLTASQVNQLGNVLCMFGSVEIDKLSNDNLKEAIDQLRGCGKFEGDVKTSLRTKITATYGTLETWTFDTVNELQTLASMFDASETNKLSVSVDLKETLKGILSQVKEPEGFVPADVNFTPDMTSLKSSFGKIVINLFFKVGRRKRAITCSSITVPTKELILELGSSSSALTADQLGCLSLDTFKETVDILGDITAFPMEKLTALKIVALAAYPTPTNNDIAGLKRITVAFTATEINTYFATPNIDALAAIGKYQDWSSDATVAATAKQIVENFLKSNAPSTLLSKDLLALGYLLCAFTPEQIATVSAAEYSSAASNIGKLKCSLPVLTALKNKAVEAFGAPSAWTTVQMQDIGTLTAALTSAEFSTISKEKMSYITPEAVSLIPPAVFQTLTIDQLRYLGTENLAAVSSQQKALLDPTKTLALNENSGATVPLTTTPSPTASGSQAHASPLAAAIALVLTLLALSQ
ncbi:otoancorin-like [Polyodon spathula]|uniref:otoancorin-like n=1 Tax=Polyodon spathula TaxID=7913 RepID=UPI001B7DBB5A|nr:otoancorin-like [Polyodon spathula]XP_041098280.1 otoancorin-like [Polyodon spathula]